MNPFFDNDSYIYDSFARFFCEHKTFFDPSLQLVPMQPLGYHFFVGMIYSFFGPNMVAVIVVQAFLALAIAYLTYRIAHRLCGESIARIAALLCITNLGLIIYTHLLLAEILVTFLLMLGWERILAYHDHRSWTRIAQAAFFFSCSALVKPLALVFALPFFLMLWRWYGIRGAGVYGIFFSVSIFLYMLRNWYFYDVFLFAPMTFVNLYQCFLSKVIAKVEGCSLEDAINKLAVTNNNLFDQNLWNMHRVLFWKYLIAYPGTCCMVWLQNVVKTCVGLFTTQLKIMCNPALRGGATSFFLQKSSGPLAIFDYLWFGTSSWFVFTLGFFEMMWNGVRFALLPMGLVALYRHNKQFVCMVSVCSVIMILATGVDGCFRYRMPLEPFLCIVIAAALYRLCKRESAFFGVILAGGSGERLWPISRYNKPKQFLSLGSNKTLLEQTIDRVSRVIKKSHITIVTNQQHAALCPPTINIISEPASRNTAPALLLACFHAMKHETDPIMVFTPADAFIPESEYAHYAKAITCAREYAQKNDRIVLLGIKPTHPATGYGYIEYDIENKNSIHAVTRFHEKPGLTNAQLYCQQPNMLWNIGMFIGRARVFLQEAERLAPEVYYAVKNYESGRGSYHTIPAISIDCAVIEKSNAVSVLPVSFSWCDVGTIESFLHIKHRHESQPSNVIHVNSQRSIVDVPDTLVALVDIDDVCVVKRNNVLVISRRSQTDKVRGVTTMLKQQNMMEYW